MVVRVLNGQTQTEIDRLLEYQNTNSSHGRGPEATPLAKGLVGGSRLASVETGA